MFTNINLDEPILGKPDGLLVYVVKVRSAIAIFTADTDDELVDLVKDNRPDLTDFDDADFAFWQIGTVGSLLMFSHPN